MTLLPTGNMDTRLQEDCTDYTGSGKSHFPMQLAGGKSTIN